MKTRKDDKIIPLSKPTLSPVKGRGGLATGGSESRLRGMSSKKEGRVNQEQMDTLLKKVQTIIEERTNIKNSLYTVL